MAVEMILLDFELLQYSIVSQMVQFFSRKIIVETSDIFW